MTVRVDGQMKPEDRLAFAVDFLKYRGEGLSRGDIAERMGMSRPTLKSREDACHTEIVQITNELRGDLKQDIVQKAKLAINTIYRLAESATNEKIQFDACKWLGDKVIANLTEVEHKGAVPVIQMNFDQRAEEVVIDGTATVSK